jgi:2-dehydro-3-deoxygluconokinase
MSQAMYWPSMVAGWRVNMTIHFGAGQSLCFGELLVRLATPESLLLSQSRSMNMAVGGAEANVAVGLASLGRSVRMVSCLPNNAMGEMVRRSFQGYGVNCDDVRFSKEGRMGLYFLETGAGHRASSIIYDRKNSSFALSKAGDYDWDVLFNGVAHLHMSGITPALCEETANIAVEAAKAARAKGILISFDGNYRSLLWNDRNVDPRPILKQLFALADICFANHRDFSLLLDRSYSGDGKERRREAAEAAFAAFPNLKLIASTARRAEEADRQFIAARIDTHEDAVQTNEAMITNIVDRIGTGDAFATGVLYALSQGHDLGKVAMTGLALNALKHSIAGDVCLVGLSQLHSFLAGQMDVQR